MKSYLKEIPERRKQIMRKRIISIISLILAAAMLCAALSLTACKKSGNDEKETSPAGVVQNNETSDGSADGKKQNSEVDQMSYEEIYQEKANEFADNSHPIAVIVMENKDAIVFELYEDIAKNTVLNFISLANSGFYDGIIFHRVIKNFMIQTGDPTGTGMGGPGYRIFGEFGNNNFKNDISHLPGVVSMARQGNRYNPSAAYNTAGSQFFICVADASYLDNDYAAFGKVIDGMDVAYAISNTATNSNDKPLSDQKMAYVRVDTHDATYAEPETIAE